MLYVSVWDVMDVVFYVSIMRRGALCTHIWEVRVFRHVDVVCLCLVCIMLQFSMLPSAWLAVCSCWLRIQEATIWKKHTQELVS